jgi:hypothetical protein
MKIIHFKIICQLSSLFAMEERNSALRSIYKRHLRVLVFEYFSNRVATCHMRNRYYCPSLLTVRQLSLSFQQLLAWNPLQTIAVRHVRW